MKEITIHCRIMPADNSLNSLTNRLVIWLHSPNISEEKLFKGLEMLIDGYCFGCQMKYFEYCLGGFITGLADAGDLSINTRIQNSVKFRCPLLVDRKKAEADLLKNLNY